FIQTSLREWAYAARYAHSAQRAAHLRPWLYRYNWHRPHRALQLQPPISKLNLSMNNLLNLHRRGQALSCLVVPTAKEKRQFRKRLRAGIQRRMPKSKKVESCWVEAGQRAITAASEGTWPLIAARSVCLTEKMGCASAAARCRIETKGAAHISSELPRR